MNEWESSRERVTMGFKLGAVGRRTTGLIAHEVPGEVQRRALEIIGVLNRDFGTGGKNQSPEKLNLIRGPLKEVLNELHCVRAEAFAYQAKTPGSRLGYVRWGGKDMHWIYLAKGNTSAYLGVIHQQADQLREVARVAMNDELYGKVVEGKLTLSKARRLKGSAPK